MSAERTPVYPALLISRDGSAHLLAHSGTWASEHDLWYWSTPEQYLIDQQCRRFDQVAEYDDEGHPEKPPGWQFTRFLTGPELVEIARRHLEIEGLDEAPLRAELEIAGQELEAVTVLEYLVRLEQRADPGIPAIESFSPSQATTAFQTVVRFGAPFVIGLIVHLIALGASRAGGPLAILILPISSVIVSGLFVALSTMGGRICTKAGIGRTWRGNYVPASLLALAGLIICLSAIYGLTRPVSSMLDDAPVRSIGLSYWLGYTMLMFGLTNWPYTRLFQTFKVEEK